MKPTLLIISATIRRDLHRPFRRFTRFRVVHAYHDAAYGDLDEGELGLDTWQYRNLAELRQLIDEVQPDLIQGPEPVASRLMLGASWIVWRWHRRTGRPYFFPNFENRPLVQKFGPVVGWVMQWWLGVYGRAAAWVFYLNQGAKQNLERLGFSDVMLDRKGDDASTAPDQASRNSRHGSLISDSRQAGSGSRMTHQKIIRANWGNWGIDRTEFALARPSSPPTRQEPRRLGNAKTSEVFPERADHPVILFIGRLSSAKGVDTLLGAFTTVRRELPTAELWLVGPATLDAGNAPLIERAHWMTGVKLLGSKKQRELPALIRQAWVSVLLSRTTKRWAEQVGMVNLQALACGTPVVTTDSGSIREYLESKNQESRIKNQGGSAIHNSQFTIRDTDHGALLVPEDDPRAAAEALLVVLHEPKRRETMGTAGVEWVKETFDEATTVPALEAEIFERYRRTIDH